MLMKTLVCKSPGFLEYNSSETPQLRKDHAIIKIKRVGICGTDLHAFEGTQPFFNYPRILGHELAGELIQFDNAPGFKEGETVSFIPGNGLKKHTIKKAVLLNAKRLFILKTPVITDQRPNR